MTLYWLTPFFFERKAHNNFVGVGRDLAQPINPSGICVSEAPTIFGFLSFSTEDPRTIHQNGRM